MYKDYATAFSWFRKGAELGDSEAQSNLGVMYQLGDGIPRDYVMAYMWHSLAAKQGNKLAIRNRTEIVKHLTPEQITEGQRMVRDWINAHSD
ncbi:Localization factor PodJL [Pseudovibrio sp. W64]|nr:tetratricopeptide repeat protein [Pseudovibrio sp. W64]KZK79119.1 Localization factor PodJL [Pseudovibrio sp. W64]